MIQSEPPLSEKEKFQYVGMRSLLGYYNGRQLDTKGKEEFLGSASSGIW